MDNVACYGSEDKLTDCTFNTQTSEDVHNNDIWIECSSVIGTSMSTINNEENNTALIISLVAVCGLLLVLVVISSVVCLCKCKRSPTRSDTVR